MTYTETEDTWRVYGLEWVVVFTSEGGGVESVTPETYYETHYTTRAGDRKLEEEHHRVSEHPMAPHRQRLEIMQWVLRGEFKHRHDAVVWKDQLHTEGLAYVNVVGRATRDETKLKDYGRRVLK